MCGAIDGWFKRSIDKFGLDERKVMSFSSSIILVILGAGNGHERADLARDDELQATKLQLTSARTNNISVTRFKVWTQLFRRRVTQSRAGFARSAKKIF